MDDGFRAVQGPYDWIKKFDKRLTIISRMEEPSPASVADTVLSAGMQSMDSKTIALAFRRPFMAVMKGPHMRCRLAQEDIK
jgi:hypothetical protein